MKSIETKSTLARVAKSVTPLRKLRRWWLNGIWSDLRLWVLTMIGYVPSHTIRNFVYRSMGVRLAKSSSIHWRARFFDPRMPAPISASPEVSRRRSARR